MRCAECGDSPKQRIAEQKRFADKPAKSRLTEILEPPRRECPQCGQVGEMNEENGFAMGYGMRRMIDRPIKEPIP